MAVRPSPGRGRVMHSRNGTPAAPDSMPWQSSWLDAYACDRRSTLPYPQSPVSALLEHAARRFPERPACTLFDETVSYAQLHEQSRRLAGALAKLGVGPGRFVGMLRPNVPEYLAALQATWLTGATALQLSPLAVSEEIDHWLARTGCHVVITLDLLAPLVMGSLQHGPLEHVVVASLAPHMTLWKSWLYHVVRVRRNGSLRFREDGHRHHFD